MADMYLQQMNKTAKWKALKIMIPLLSLVIIFHVAVIIRAIPYEIVWAGKLKSVDEMYAFETASIAINIFIIALLFLKAKHIKRNTSNKILDALLWLFVILFAANTVGNLLAETWFEKLVFTPLTLLSSILIWVIVRKNTKMAESLNF